MSKPSDTCSPLAALATDQSSAGFNASGNLDCELSPIHSDLRSQQGMVQRARTALKQSSVAGEAERKLAQTLADSKLRIASTAISLNESQVTKTMVAQSATRNQQLNEKLGVQEMAGLTSLSELASEGMMQHATSHAHEVNKVDTLLIDRRISAAQHAGLQQRLEGLRLKTEVSFDRCTISSIEDTAAHFGKARTTLNQS